MIDSFTGENRWLSNMAKLKVPIKYDGVEYYSVENFYVAIKTKDNNIRKHIATLLPHESKKFGRIIELRDDWEEVKYIVMQYGVREKFSKEPFKSKLLATGDQLLVEGNWWGDTYWGVCNGKGENNLGKILMEVRGELNENH